MMKTNRALLAVRLVGVVALISAAYCFWLMTVPLSYDLVYVVVAGFLLSLIVFVVALISSVIIAIRLRRSACTGTPGTQIGNSAVATAPAAPCALASANFGTAGVRLTAGVTYWVVVTTDSTSTQIGTTAVWWQVNAANQSYNLDDGNGWNAGPLGGPGGFMVQ